MVDFTDIVPIDDSGDTTDTLIDSDARTPELKAKTQKNPVVSNWPVSPDVEEAQKASDQDKFLRRYGITGSIDKRFQDVLDAQEKQHAEEVRIGLEKKAQDEASLAAIQKLQQPNLPTLKNIPSAPPSDAYQYQNPFLAFQNPGVFLGLMASFLTRTPLTAAFNSAAAAIKGFHEGDKQAIDTNIEHWKDSVDQAIKQNKVETDKYQELWERYHNNYERLLAEMQAHAAGFKDDMMLAQLRYAGPKETWDLIQKRIDSGVEIEKSKAEVEKAHADAEYAHTRAQLMATGAISPEALDFGVKRLLAGEPMKDVFPNLGRGIQGDAARRLVLDELTKQAHEQNLSPQDIIERSNARAASRVGATAEARTAATRSAALDIVAREVDKQIPDTEAAAQKFWRSGFVPLNVVNNWTQSHLLSTAGAADFKAANLQLAELWARSMNPSGVMRESDRAFALDLLSTAASPAAYKAVIERLKKSIGRMREAIREFRSDHLREPNVDDPSKGTKSELPPAKDIYARTGETAAGKSGAAPEAPATDSSGWITDTDTGIRVRPIGGETTPPPPAAPPTAPSTDIYTPR